MSIKIIAEVGNTHEGSLGLAKCFIKSASETGADYVKFQTHMFEFESLDNAPNPSYFSSESRKDYFNRTSFTLEEYKVLFDFSKQCNIEFISSPFSVEAVELLEEVGISLYKIPSGEVSNTFLLKSVAKTRKPVILSSGMSSLDELDYAFETLKSNNSGPITILQCTSEYPCPPENVGLEYINLFKSRYFSNVGLSDHTYGIVAPVLAASYGVSLIEKHFTLSKQMYGSDAKNSLDPSEFKTMVDSVRDAEKMLNNNYKKNVENDNISFMKNVFEKSLVYKSDISKGTLISEEMLTAKKPGSGIPIKNYIEIISNRINSDVKKNDLVDFKHFK